MRRISTSVSSPHISIRTVKASDGPKLIRISQSRAKALPEEGGMPWGGFSYSALKPGFERDLKSQKRKEAVFLVAEADGDVIGSCIIKRSPRKHRSHMGMLGIEIAYGHQGMGVGQLLMEESIGAAKRAWKGLEIVHLGVNGSNRQAIRAYEKFGFKRVAEVPNVIKWKGKYYPDISMHLRVG